MDGKASMGIALDGHVARRGTVHHSPRGIVVVANGTSGALHRGLRHDGSDALDPGRQETARGVSTVRAWPWTALLTAGSFVAAVIVTVAR